MDSRKKRKLREMGGRVTTAAEFLGLSQAEAIVVELRLELADAVRKKRTASGMTQAELAKAMGVEPGARSQDGRRGSSG